MKAVVMSKAGKLNIVLCDNGTFRKIKGSYEIGQTLEVRKSDFIQPRKISAGAVFSGLAACAAVFLGLCFYEVTVPYSYVTLDADASIEYSLNRLNKVVDIRALDKDSEAIVERLKRDGIKNDTLAKAIEMTVVVLKENDYLSANDNEVVIGVVSNDEKLRNKLSNEIETGSSSADKDISLSILQSEKQDREEAMSQGISTGKYKLTKQSTPTAAATVASVDNKKTSSSANTNTGSSYTPAPTTSESSGGSTPSSGGGTTPSTSKKKPVEAMSATCSTEPAPSAPSEPSKQDPGSSESSVAPANDNTETPAPAPAPTEPTDNKTDPASDTGSTTETPEDSGSAASSEDSSSGSESSVTPAPAEPAPEPAAPEEPGDSGNYNDTPGDDAETPTPEDNSGNSSSDEYFDSSDSASEGVNEVPNTEF